MDDIVKRLMDFVEKDDAVWAAVHEIQSLREQLRERDQRIIQLEVEREYWQRTAARYG